MTASIDNTELDDFLERESDSIEELDAVRLAEDPGLASLMEAALEQQVLLHTMAVQRKGLKISQAEVARRMGTSQAFISRLERATVDPQHSTEDRYAQAIGMKIKRTLVPQAASRAMPAARTASRAMPAYASGDSLGSTAHKRKS